ncbi:MAG: mechanosensitive ion channel [Bacteroidales bacterium]|nr:mechanosensitive ion channel [Bacteroidales bacterium]
MNLDTIKDITVDKLPGGMPDLTRYVTEFLVDYGIKLIGAIVVLIIGLWVIGKLTRASRKMMTIRNVDPSLRSFLGSLISITMKILLVIIMLSMVGVQMTSVIAILGAAGLAVGLALQGTLQNFAGGVIILLFKPFKVGDYIEAQGFSGTVSEIQIFNSLLTTPDNKVVFIPNGGLATGSLTNFSRMTTRRVDWVFGIAYGDDYAKAKALILAIIQADPRSLHEPEPFIALKELANSSVNIVVRVWVKTDDYWPLFFELNEQVYRQFAHAGISIPFPQMDVHLIQKK